MMSMSLVFLLCNFMQSENILLNICNDIVVQTGLMSMSYDTYHQRVMCFSWGICVSKTFPGTTKNICSKRELVISLP